jgi:transcriptional regulator with XRE-family HTH domain
MTLDKGNQKVIVFLKDLMKRKKKLPSKLAADLSVSHATVIRWLRGTDIPSPESCKKLARYSGQPLERVLAYAGHIPEAEEHKEEFPSFVEYAREKYPELDEQLIESIGEIIEDCRTRRQK